MSDAPRIAIGGIIHETHAFATVLTTLQEFAAQTLLEGEGLLETLAGSRAGIAGMIAGSTARGWNLLPTLYAAALPAGMVDATTYATLRDRLLSRLRDLLPVDGVLLALHGAMVVDGTEDAESDLLAAVRATIGADTPLVVELDMHGNIGDPTVELADALVAFDTNPHIDPYERGEEAAALLDRLLRERSRTARAIARPPLILAPQSTATADLPLRAAHERARLIKADPQVLSICVMGGFAYADLPCTGPSVIVTTTGNAALAQAYADELAELIWSHRDAALPDFFAPREGVARALAMPGGPIILVDSADNIGGGTPGDGTDALRAMLEANVPESAVVLADPEAVRLCQAAGEGATLTLAVGGKADRWHGDPVTVTGRVERVLDGTFPCELKANHFAAFYGDTLRMGQTAWLRVGAINIVLTERKTPPFDLAQLRGVGVIPEAQKLIVVKSAVAYRAAYMPIAAGVVELDTAGLCSANLSRFPYRRLRRPIYPLDELV